MDTNRTIQALASISDEGLFERLATTILREDKPLYKSLVQTGVNDDGKTVKAPLDGICFVHGARLHLIAVHHTTSARNELKRKWLYDPDAVTHPDKSKKSSTPPGDFIKTAKIVAEERKKVPDLQATLILTTNREPSVEVISEVMTAGHVHDIEIDFWSCSKLAHFLDNSPVGHWIRRQFLQIEQEFLSPELLHELSLKSLEINHPPGDNDKAWIPRALDEILASSLHRDVTFVVAGTGQGKSVACYRRLASHVQAGGFGLILSHDAIASATTLDQAIADTLRQLHPALASGEETALSICSPERPLLLIVEDINRADRTQFLAEKIANWSRTQAETEDKSNWHLLCPLWPETLTLLGDQARKRIESLLVFADGFSEDEGRDAVIARARLAGNEFSSSSALLISQSLGHDPLLIALYDFDNTPDPSQVIDQFINHSLSRTAAAEKEYPPAEYRKTLRLLAGEMLAHRQIDPQWLNVSEWANIQGEPLRLIGRIANRGELIHLTNSTVNQRLEFRHDRVRDWLLADATAELERRNALPDCIVAEPYYAEVIGTVLVSSSPGPNFLRRVAEANPLALFHALRLASNTAQSSYDAIFQAIDSWLDNPATHDRSNLHLRLEALAILAETDSQHVPAIARKFLEQIYSGQLARLRNGDITGGVELCMRLEPGVGAPWRDIQIEHAKLHHDTKLSRDLDGFLRRKDLNGPTRVGALRLAGHIGNPDLARAIEICWNIDDEKLNHLIEYLWAFGRCCGNEPARFLGPVCDAWAALPDEPEREGDYSPREALAAYELRFAFRRWPPQTAIDYFVQRATHDDLKRPITIMLNDIDHPKALAFRVQERAVIWRQTGEINSFSYFMFKATNEWRRAQEEGRPMSDASRELLLSLWQNDENDKFLRSAAFSLWAATKREDDLDVLRRISVPEYLADHILEQRLVRGDQQAIPDLIEKLSTNNKDYWWHQARYLWSPELTDELDKLLSNRGGGDSIASELIMRLPTKEAERLLLKHWDQLRFSFYFVQAALYVATKPLLEVAATAIKDCSKPSGLMMHLGMHFGIKVKDHPGLKRENQVLALGSYLDLLSDQDISRLWDECNDRGWFATRKKLLDSRLGSSSAHRIWNRDRVIKEFDSMVEEERHPWIDHWIDQQLKADVSWSEIFETLMVWLEARRSLEALKVVAWAVMFRGRREDLSLLRNYEDMDENEVKELICDTEFAVRRRTLS